MSKPPPRRPQVFDGDDPQVRPSETAPAADMPEQDQAPSPPENPDEEPPTGATKERQR